MKTFISTEAAPAAIGPYSQGVIVNGMVYTSGQLPIDVESGEMPSTIEEQTRASLTNVRSIVEAGGSSMSAVIKTTVFLSDMNNFAKMNEVYATFFQDGPCPSRSAVEVARLPKDALVEIEAIAVVEREIS